MIGEIIIQFNTGTGEYELRFTNISHPGQGIEYSKLYEVIRRVVGQVDEDIAKDSSSIQGQVINAKDSN